ncbi:hypothetical protein NQ315_002963 [Exocentrus adspersus]|uniref:Uncharacterized protein n=1 Tax=Exocentrus adspersus TaxID=1586481 RepID=A0AAV8W4I4_9CUCU|nr:hypothetical protein NQ315_002963 [Exocentrus adspersus]
MCLNNMCMTILIVGIILSYAVICTSLPSNDEELTTLSRQKRSLLYPPETNVIQLIIGIGVPVELKSQAVVFGWGFRAFYRLPSNLSEVRPMDESARRTKRSLSRWDVYRMLEQMSDMKGLGGRVCILRTICEAADIPIDKPTTTNENINHYTDNQYYAAQELGRKNPGKCMRLFPECKHTLLDMFTESDEYD